MNEAAALAIPYRVEPMLVSDVDAVMPIENAAYTTPWPVSAYRHELEQNSMAHYLVLLPEEGEAGTPTSLRERLRGWLRRPQSGRAILGYGGFWLMVGEAHISTIVVDEEWRGMGLGELLLLELIELALRLGAEMVTLEVRVSNTVAQGLYEKYGFEYTGRRKRYYRDNNEDAHIMTVEEVRSAEYRAFLDQQWLRVRERLARVDGPRRTNGQGQRNGAHAAEREV
jgi:ribosomal-protein-alanine N-acetyltransferase